MIRTNKKPSCSGKGTARWMFCIYLCRNHLFWAFAAGVLWKTQFWNSFAGVPTAEYIVSFNHCGSLQDDYCVLFFNLKFLIPTLCHMFCLPKPSNIYWVLFCERSWKNVDFCGFKKRGLFLMGEKYKWIFPKHVKFF